jgi:hypothetical protein
MIQPSNIRCNGPGLQPCLPGPQFWLNQVGDTGNMPCPPGRSAFSLGCMYMDSKILLNHLYELEIEVRNDKNRLDELLHESFIEVGRYGKTYHKSDILANLPKQAISGAIRSQDYNLEVLSNDLALITDKSAMMDENGNLSIHTFRPSLWQKVTGSWRIRFHQWTPASKFTKSTT